MDYRVSEDGGRLVVSLSGSLTFSDAGKFGEVVSHFDRKLGGAEIEMTGLESVDSTGMSLLVHAYDAAQKNGYQVTIRGARSNVRSVLSNAGFDELVTMT